MIQTASFFNTIMVDKKGLYFLKYTINPINISAI